MTINLNMRRFLIKNFSTVLALTIVSTTFTFQVRAADSCLDISNNEERLSCYDELANPIATEATADERTVPASFLGRRIELDAERKTFTLTARRPNYIIHTYSEDPNQEPYEFTGDSDRLDNSEVKFQLSFQTKVADDMFGKQADLWFSYTQVAFWQLYSDDISSPFRETNYEPEVYAAFLTNYDFLGLTGRSINFGLNHQSNGRGDPLSRSWNRVFAEFVFVRDDFGLSFKPWYRIEESSSDDDNPDIEDYLGNYEFRAFQRWGDHLFSVMLRNVFDDDNHYNSELQWSFPIKRRLRGLVQWYNGYGENLIDHDHKSNRIGVGILMTDWL
jgi:phospholipase A1